MEPADVVSVFDFLRASLPKTFPTLIQKAISATAETIAEHDRQSTRTAFNEWMLAFFVST
jgi:hypothetical protein